MQPAIDRGLGLVTGSCRRCGVASHGRREALFCSLVFPGGGYFYIRRHVLGALDALVEAALLFVVVGRAGMALSGEPGVWPSVAILGALLLVTKAGAAGHSMRCARQTAPAIAGTTAQTRPRLVVDAPSAASPR